MAVINPFHSFYYETDVIINVNMSFTPAFWFASKVFYFLTQVAQNPFGFMRLDQVGR